jgi:hypothetical protein
MCTATLKITDGTTTVNLLDPDSGILLDSWIPALPGWKSGGIYTNNQLAEGRILQDAHRDNITESMTLNVRNTSMDAVIRDSQNLRRLLEKAVQYWTTNWQNDPVWIEAKGKEESNTRYAVIVNYATPSDVNPYAQPFAATRLSPYLMNGLALVLEHQPWTGNEPGTGTAVELSAVEAFDGRNLGNVDSAGVRDPTADDEVFVRNTRITANLTDIYIDDGGVFSANLLNAALPYALLPAVPAVNDAVYFGIDSTVANSGPLGNLVFDIGTGGLGYTSTWEYWNGAAWTAITPRDNTNGGSRAFELTGVNLVTLSSTTNTTAVNGITAYWVRLRVTGIPGALTAPTQQNRNVYSVIWPYTEADSVAGDIEALGKHILTNVSKGTSTLYDVDRLLVGIRSVDRGENFSAYLNAADEQNPLGVVCTAVGSTAFADNTVSPTGRAAQYNPAGALPFQDSLYFTISNPYTSEYSGKYKAFLRCGQIAGTVGDISVRIQIRYGTISYTFFTGESATITARFGAGSTPYPELVDLGNIELPTDDDLGTILLVVQCENDPARSNGDLWIFDLVLIPVDEWAVDTKSIATPDVSSSLYANNYLTIDSISTPKRGVFSNVRDSSDILLINWGTISNGENIIQVNKRVRFWYTWAWWSTGLTADKWWYPTFNSVLLLNIQKQSRYLSMRGDR